ncbi:LacI family DNA-binding transcriptional regulator [Rhizomonospora bruguierae]|uniref:LacI family DNA-binding transcriptional regulator n=1 Tax=Rhizomonospora bruguierae TaxID=1581705 RepID=UPI0020BE7AB7|nr:LacI family DNA-binding transcriptional regulator [Micromonospora sp. NBRC 107566]
MAALATIYDVAQRAKVSAATVSRVVNGRSSVDPALVARVREAMRELDYRPNAVARNLRRNRTSLWAVIISDIGNPFFTTLVRGVEDVAQTSGYSVVLCNSDEDPVKEHRYIDAALAEQMAGVIISPSGRPAEVHRLLGSRTPVVAVDRELAGTPVDAVLVDNAHGAERATAHLVQAGYRRIGCVTGPRRLSTATERLRGYRDALAAAGLPYEEELVRHADFREAGGYQAMASLLELACPPDAVFVANNLMAIGAVRCLVARGVRMPDELGMVAFDDIPWASLVRPTLTTVVQPTYELGRAAARLLADRLADPSRPPSTVTLPTELRVGESSARAATADPVPG